MWSLQKKTKLKQITFLKNNVLQELPFLIYEGKKVIFKRF